MPAEPTSEEFDAQLDVLSASCTVLPLTAALQHLRDGTLPKAAVSITFDDGYRNNYSVALPLLRKFGMSATFFISTAYLGQGLMWNDAIIESIRSWKSNTLDLSSLALGLYDLSSDERRVQALSALLLKLKYLPANERSKSVEAVCRRLGAELPERLMLAADEIRELRRGGMEIGAHTVNHPILASLTGAEAEHEILSSKADLESILGEKVCLFAYPNGKPGKDYTGEHVDCLRRSGFTAAVTTAPGYADARTDPLELPRVTVWSKERLRTQYHLFRLFNGV